MVVENGGTFSMNLNDSVTHCIAAEKKGIRYQAAVRHGDIIHYSWVLDCCKQKRLLHLQPKYFLFFAGSSKRKLQEEIDAFSDYFYWDVDITDIKQIFSNIVGLEDLDRVEYYKKKYCPLESLCLFRGCCIYFFEAMPIINMDCKVISDLALRRMRLEITMHTGEVCNSLTGATHLLVYSMNESYDFDDLYKSFPLTQRHLLHSKKLHIVRYEWLEESMKKGTKLPEDAYNLKPDSLEDLEMDRSEHSLELLASTSNMENHSVSTLLNKRETRKRARPALRNTGKAKPKPAKRTRARVGNRPAKIDRDESASSDSSVETNQEEALELRKFNNLDGKHIEACESLAGTLVTKDRNGSEDTHPAELRSKQDSVQKKFDEGLGSVQVEEDNSGKGEQLEQMVHPLHGLDSMHVAEDNLGKGEKLEQMVDPLHAMLLDMIPSLSQRNVETESSTTEAAKQQPGVDANPVKKKVSYKDVAGQLLKDW